MTHEEAVAWLANNFSVWPGENDAVTVFQADIGARYQVQDSQDQCPVENCQTVTSAQWTLGRSWAETRRKLARRRAGTVPNSINVKYAPPEGAIPNVSCNPVLDRFIDAANKPDDPFHELGTALLGAFDQARSGKGQQRHGNGRPFTEQPMLVISEMIGSVDGMAYQVIKKTQESLRMETDAAIRELQGAIIYAAGMIVRLSKTTEDQQ